MKDKLAIIVDSGTDIPEDIKQKFHIFEIPFQITYGNTTFEDRVNITADEVYHRLSFEIPKTSLPNGEHIIQLFNQLVNEHYTDAMIFTISDKLTGTYQFIKTITMDYPMINWHYFNTKNIGIGAGLFALEAAQLYENGQSISEIENQVFDISKSKVYFKLDTLEYLKKGGRIGRVQANIGTLLKIKPVITCDMSGTYKTYKKIRSDKQFYKIIQQVITTAIEQYGPQHICIGIGEGGAKKEAITLKEYIRSINDHIPIIMSTVSPALGVHTGPGLQGIAIYHF